MEDAAASLLVETAKLLLNLVKKELQLPKKVRDGVESLSVEFDSIKNFLLNARRLDREHADPMLVGFIDDLRGVCADIQLVSNQLHYIIDSHPSLEGGAIVIQKHWRYHRIAREITRLRERITQIHDDRRNYRTRYESTLPANDFGASSSGGAEEHLVDKAYLVGIDDPKKALISNLLTSFEDSKPRAVAVCGMGGSGKTTLVAQVYDDEAVKDHFKIRAWTKVSQKWEFRGIIMDLIQQVASQVEKPVPSNLETMQILELEKALLEIIKEKETYLIVFDDVWSTEIWNAFRLLLPPGNSSNTGGYRVMFTTRDHGVAKAAMLPCEGYLHTMEMLSSTDSWSLFYQRTFGDVNNFPNELLGCAKRILNICGGLPLGIVVIAGHLAWIGDLLSEWEAVATRLEERCPNIVNKGDDMASNIRRINETIALSYDDLPDQHKDCLLYTNIYSSLDPLISSEMFMMLLVAEKIVDDTESAWAILTKLERKSLIQLNQGRYNGPHATIRIHDLIGEFISTRSNQEYTSTTIRTTEEISNWSAKTKVTRLVIHPRLLDITSPESPLYANHFRSIINFRRKNSIQDGVLPKLLNHPHSLTVLDLRGFPMKEIPELVFKLTLLTFLALGGITKIPTSIKHLKKLQFFLLQLTRVQVLPEEITQLQDLCVVIIHTSVPVPGPLTSTGFLAPKDMGHLVKLQNLHTINVGGSHETVVDEIGLLVQLRDLSISNLRTEDGKKLCASLGKLGKLHELFVASSSSGGSIPLDLDHDLGAINPLQSLHQLDLYGELNTIPRWIKHLQKLENITLYSSRSAQNPVEALEDLPHLTDVWLIDAYTGEELMFKAGKFPKLKFINIKVCPTVKRVEIQKNAMPVLNKLTLDTFPILEELPQGITHLGKLQELILFAVNPIIISKLENKVDGSEYGKISDVPRVMVAESPDDRGVWKIRPLSRNREFHVQPTPDAPTTTTHPATYFTPWTLPLAFLFLILSVLFVYFQV